MGPVTTLPLEKTAQVDLRQAARYFGEPGEPDAATLALLARVAPPVLAAAMPRAVWRRCDVAELEASGFLRGQDVPAHLADCDEALLLAVTLGAGVDRQIRLSGIGDIAAGVAADALAIVKEYPALRGVFHCYSGSVEMARELLALGWYLGFDGPVTYKNARKTVEVAEMVPLDRILIETDSPYMSPVPMRGKRNDSRNVCYIAEKLAQTKGMTTEEMARLTMENGKKLFDIK